MLPCSIHMLLRANAPVSRARTLICHAVSRSSQEPPGVFRRPTRGCSAYPQPRRLALAAVFGREPELVPPVEVEVEAVVEGVGRRAEAAPEGPEALGLEP